jgi:hypothetical protein
MVTIEFKIDVMRFPEKFLLTGMCERKCSEVQAAELCDILQERNYHVNRIGL